MSNTMHVQVDDLAAALMEQLNAYTDEVTDKVMAAVDKVADETKEVIEKHAPSHWKHYRRAFRVKETYRDMRNKRKTWYVAAPYYRLTHLLEYGHATRNGGRTRAFRHIQYGEDWAQKRLPEEIEKAVKGE
ncbi:HK97 gp10 family phage protein [Ethanoligenens sp.]|uniref:HK97 gp10 family phage protein n=1 Tax=Ethanoligenens sp. TaxID=2099655 RepID=UPI0039E7E393